jgi:hypothetical protein
VSPTEAARRLRLAQDGYADAKAAGHDREAKAYSIAVDVLAELAASGTQTD